MRTVTESFDDFDDRYTLHFSHADVRVERNEEIIYEGPVSALVVPGEFHAVSVGRAISADIDTVAKETVAQLAEHYLQSTPLR